jgi:uncharacterized membrane protein YgcG
MPVALALLVSMARIRDRVPDVPPILEQPPEDDPVAAAFVWSAWHGSLSPRNAYRAQVLRLSRLGAVELRGEGMVTDPRDLTLVRKADPLDLQTQTDQDFQSMLFGSGEDAAEEISIRHPRPRAGRKDASAKYSAWLTGARARSRDLLDRIRRGDSRIESVGATVVAIGAAGYGIWTAIWGEGGRLGWWLLPAAVVCLIVALTLIPARLGAEDRTRVMRLAAFRRYLKNFSDLPNAPALAVVIWDRYLEWAVALGVAKEVEKQVTALVPVESLRAPILGGPSGLAGLTTWHLFQTATPTIVGQSVASARTASSGSTGGGYGSFSSSGFSGGGFSGGGGGGGGGTGGGAG